MGSHSKSSFLSPVERFQQFRLIELTTPIPRGFFVSLMNSSLRNFCNISVLLDCRTGCENPWMLEAYLMSSYITHVHSFDCDFYIIGVIHEHNLACMWMPRKNNGEQFLCIITSPYEGCPVWFLAIFRRWRSSSPNETHIDESGTGSMDRLWSFSTDFDFWTFFMVLCLEAVDSTTTNPPQPILPQFPQQKSVQKFTILTLILTNVNTMMQSLCNFVLFACTPRWRSTNVVTSHAHPLMGEL